MDCIELVINFTFNFDFFFFYRVTDEALYNPEFCSEGYESVGSALQAEQVGCAEKRCVFVSLTATLPSPHGHTPVPPEARISGRLLGEHILDGSSRVSQQGPAADHRPTLSLLCGLWVKFEIFHPSISSVLLSIALCLPPSLFKYIQM